MAQLAQPASVTRPFARGGTTTPRVALLMASTSNNDGRTLKGIAEFCQIHGPWKFLVEGARDINCEDLANGARVDGVILGPAPQHGADFINEARRAQVLVEAVQRRRLPCVALEPFHDAPLPRVMPDDAEAGRVAARDFLRRGFTRFGFCGFRNVWFSDDRLAGFTEVLAEAGHAPAVYDNVDTPFDMWKIHDSGVADHIAQWVLSLGTPAAVFAVSDWRARHVLISCAKAGLMVPEEVSVIAVDNDVNTCEVTDPPLSSVPLDAARMGYEAAAMLSRLMAGERLPVAPVRVPPLPLVTRRSSAAYAVQDADVAAALRYITEHANVPLSVAAVALEVGLSRRSLQIKFRRALRRTVQQEIGRAHVERAKRLLSETRLPIYEVATASGFTAPDRFSRAFHRLTGRTPRAYRAASQRTTQVPQAGHGT